MRLKRSPPARPDRDVQMLLNWKFFTSERDGTKMNIDEITIGNAKKLLEMFQQTTPALADSPLVNGALCIVIADRGWVWVGKADQVGDAVHIHDARCIRRWGTTDGLAQLATDGPQPDTKLESPATVRVPLRSVVAVIPCRQEAWAL